MEFLIFLLALGVIGVIIFIQAAIAAQFSIIAEEKGYTDPKYFWFCVFLGIVGYLMVVALPDKKLANAISEIKKGDSPEEHSLKNVSNSGFSLKGTANVPYGQKGSRYSRGSMSASGWECKGCGRFNAEYTGTCACGKSKSEN